MNLVAINNCRLHFAAWTTPCGAVVWPQLNISLFHESAETLGFFFRHRPTTRTADDIASAVFNESEPASRVTGTLTTTGSSGSRQAGRLIPEEDFDAVGIEGWSSGGLDC